MNERNRKMRWEREDFKTLYHQMQSSILILRINFSFLALTPVIYFLHTHLAYYSIFFIKGKKRKEVNRIWNYFPFLKYESCIIYYQHFFFWCDKNTNGYFFRHLYQNYAFGINKYFSPVYIFVQCRRCFLTQLPRFSCF